jgi:hypothetical protein
MVERNSAWWEPGCRASPNVGIMRRCIGKTEKDINVPYRPGIGAMQRDRRTRDNPPGILGVLHDLRHRFE